MKRFACLRLPNWPVQRLAAEQPELTGRALLLYRHDARRGEYVVAGSETARRSGVRPGMPLAEATALLKPGERSGAAVRAYDPAADRAALARLAERCEPFSPLVGWETAAEPGAGARAGRNAVPAWFGESPGHLFLDVTGIAALFGGEEALAQLIGEECGRAGYDGRVAVADTLGAAWAVTESDAPLTIVPPGGLESVLRPLPVSTLRLTADVLDILAQLGVLTVDQLLRLSRTGLAERFGRPLLARLDQAFNATAEVIVPHRPPPAYRADVALDFPTDRRDELDALVARLIDRVTADLRARDAGAVRLAVHFDCVPATPAAFTVGLFRPTASPKHLLELARLRCERLALPGPVERVRLLATHTAPLEYQQGELFPDEARGAEHLLAPLLERLGSRVGTHAVARPQPRADALPERAFVYVPLLPAGSGPQAAGRKGRSSSLPAACGLLPAAYRPLRLFTPPIPVEAVSVVPDGPPVAFLWQRRRHVAARHWGPERIETGWWRRGLVRRDYYRVETGEGCRFWLFRDLTDGAWHLHGSFE